MLLVTTALQWRCLATTLTEPQSSGSSVRWMARLALRRRDRPMYCRAPSLSYMAYTPEAEGNAEGVPAESRKGTAATLSRVARAASPDASVACVAAWPDARAGALREATAGALERGEGQLAAARDWPQCTPSAFRESSSLWAGLPRGTHADVEAEAWRGAQRLRDAAGAARVASIGWQACG